MAGGGRRFAPGGGARRTVRVTALLAAAALVSALGSAELPRRGEPPWASPGLVGGGGWPFASQPLDPADAAGAAYVPDSSVVRLKDGRVRLIPLGAETAATLAASDPRVASAVTIDKAWLARGSVPGLKVPVLPENVVTAPRGGEAPSVTAPATRAPSTRTVVTQSNQKYRDMAARALLDLRLLTQPNGASLASWYGAWRYSWPRDSAFAAAAFTVTGHRVEAQRILRFLAGVQAGNGMWAARYNAGGSAVADGRAPQSDSLGWVLWAAWLFHEKDPDAAAGMPELWTMVRRAADRLAGSLGADGMPPPSSDYWERSPGSEQDPGTATLGVVAPVLAGMRSAAEFARETGHAADASRWEAAAARLDGAVAARFAPLGYPRSAVRDGRMDTSVTFLTPPFAPADPFVAGAVRRAADKLALPNGGVLPGERWSGNQKVAWTPEMALFTLSAAASGRTAEAVHRLDWLAAHRTSLGSLPEKVDDAGRPAAVAPLGWTASLVVLSLSALEAPLPVPGVCTSASTGVRTVAAGSGQAQNCS
ncbi:glycoside hydrolase family 15 [Actinomadura parmotrematis]|uniref:Glycoside hydrolase family 15 n=1 Tax=Actinomadura parmotrematis TaxID=2864039 RepID=A0ABS7G2J8_9ACTN|nr:glycoside hydrolase family 15 [Actinomadura parmotrematis]MBW8486943.1 glycoside hydrolase family 15 [Actinomadura parmotrematis]